MAMNPMPPGMANTLMSSGQTAAEQYQSQEAERRRRQQMLSQTNKELGIAPGGGYSDALPRP